MVLLHGTQSYGTQSVVNCSHYMPSKTADVVKWPQTWKPGPHKHGQIVCPPLRTNQADDPVVRTSRFDTAHKIQAVVEYGKKAMRTLTFTAVCPQDGTVGLCNGFL